MSNFPLSQEVNVQSVNQFSWDETLSIVSEKAPVLFGAIKGAVTTKANQDSMYRHSRVNLKPRVGTALAILLNAKAPRKVKLLHTVLSVQFWRGRLKRETMKQLSHLGLCAGYEATLSAIDKIRKDFDTAAVRLKENAENALQRRHNPLVIDQEQNNLSIDLAALAPNIDDEAGYYSDMEETILYSDMDESIQLPNTGRESDEDEEDDEVESQGEEDDDREESIEEEDEDDSRTEDEPTDLRTIDEGGEEDEDEGMEVVMDDSALLEFIGSEDEAEVPPGFTMCWDNVGKKVVTRHPTEQLKNRYLNMALGYIAINRVSSAHLNWANDEIVKKAADIGIECFIPGLIDVDQLRSRMNVLVGRILTRHLAWFASNFSEFNIPHMLHAHSLESSYKSVLINLGVFNENPSSTQGAIGIYQRLQKYVPEIDGKLQTAIVYGDGLSCERGNDAHLARCNGLNPTERLEGLEPGVQEFHKEMLLLQDFYDMFFKASSAPNRGTLCQIKNLFNFRQVKSDISDNFSQAWELMALIVEGFICLLMMKQCGMNDPTSRPENAPDNIENGNSDEKYAYFKQMVNKIVDIVWHSLDVDSLKTNDGTGVPLLCCGEETDEDLIGCDSRSSCQRGEFFHYSCVGLDPENVPSPWFCSDECRNRTPEPYRFCECQTDRGSDEPMIGCSAETLCTRFEWYHMRCVNIKSIPKGKWYCCDACKALSKTKRGQKPSSSKYDYVYKHNIALIWKGLNLLCRRDAVREADGEAMLSFWKFDLVHFFGTKHPKYVILAHRLIAAVNGWLSPKLRHDLVHNRTVNYGGGMGRNLPLDFMNEILNRLFKDLLESAKGRYTDTTIQRCSQIIGPLGDALDKVFDTKIVENELYRHRRRAQNRDNNVLRLMEILSEDKLFSTIPGRRHSAFPDFDLNETPKQAGKFSAKMKQLSKRLDRRKAIIIDA